MQKRANKSNDVEMYALEIAGAIDSSINQAHGNIYKYPLRVNIPLRNYDLVGKFQRTYLYMHYEHSVNPKTRQYKKTLILDNLLWAQIALLNCLITNDELNLGYLSRIPGLKLQRWGRVHRWV